MALFAVDRDSVDRIATSLMERFHCRVLRPATSGLGMLQIRDSVSLEGFFLGEFTVSTAAVELTDDSGNSAFGGSSIMVDDEGLALSIAILDAVMAHRWEGCAEVEDLVSAGRRRLEEVERERRAILLATAVDFSTLDEA